MLYPELPEELRNAGSAFEAATSEDIIELGEKYLELLEEYYKKLCQHPGSSQGGLQPAPSSSWEAVHDIQQAIKDTLDRTVQEHKRVGTLLDSLIYLTGEEVIETLNRLEYKGRAGWKFGEGGVTDGSGQALGLQEAVNIASLLRRQEYIENKSRSANP